MKAMIIVLAMLTSFAASAKAYKCTVNGRTTYQQKPCPQKGGEFAFKHNISPEQQAAAKAEHQAYLHEKAAQEQAVMEYIDKERMILAEELKAIGELKNARQSARQARALEQRNQIELLKAFIERR